MEYKYTINENYEDFACGRVIYHMGGAPTFPVRLTLELYERCLHYLNKKENICLYDCCCGGAYMLTILGLLKNATIAEIYGSDLDEASMKLARDNIGLLTGAGLQRRRTEIETLYQEYGKESHLQALQSIERIEKLIHKELKTGIFKRNALEVGDLPFLPDIIMTDVPYGNMTFWEEGDGGVNRLMEALSEVCGKDTVICVCMDKKQKIQTNTWQRLEKQQIGKRKYEIYRKKIFGTLTCAKEYEKQGKLEEWVQLFLRGDGKNITLAEGLTKNNFQYIGLAPIRLTELSVSSEIPEYITASEDIKWFNQEIEQMLAAIKTGWDMPPLIVHYLEGKYYPFDGRHRNVALHKLGREEAMAVIVVNSEEDAKAIQHKLKF